MITFRGPLLIHFIFIMKKYLMWNGQCCIWLALSSNLNVVSFFALGKNSIRKGLFFLFALKNACTFISCWYCSLHPASTLTTFVVWWKLFFVYPQVYCNQLDRSNHRKYLLKILKIKFHFVLRKIFLVEGIHWNFEDCNIQLK